MHIPDGFIDPVTSLATLAVAGGGIALCLRRARATVTERTAPMAGLTAAYIFAVQMINFPVAAGTSGHLLGGALAAVLVGPWLGALAVTVVLILQALLFADGGLLALGLNVINMAFVTVAVGWAGFRACTWLATRARSGRAPGNRGIALAAAFGALLSVPAAAMAFSLEYAIGGNGAISATTVMAAMTGVHVLIGVGEALITGLTVAAVLASRPDLVYGAQSLRERAVAPAIPAVAVQ